MPSSIERITELLAEAKKARQQAEAELAETQAKVDRIDSIKLNIDLSLPRTAQQVEVAKENFAKMKEYQQKAVALNSAIDVLIEGMANISGLGKKAGDTIQKIGLLDQKKRFAEAHALNDELENEAINFETDIDLQLRKHILEIIAWTRCALWGHEADTNVAQGVASLAPEVFEKYASAVNELPLGFHTEEAKADQLDKLFGLRCYDRGLTTLNSPRSMEDLQALLALLDEANSVEKHLPSTVERIAYLHGVATEEYNRLAEQFFDLDRNYDKALELFLIRGYFEETEIVHDDYRLAVDENDFRLRFLDREALRESDSEFSVSVYAYADSIQKEDETEFEVLCRYALLNGISDDKVAFLTAAINRMNFELGILFLGNVLERGLLPARQEIILHNLIAKKEKVLDLEKCAKALLNCKTLLDEPLRPAYEKMQEDLLRSPHARKAVTKSAKPEAHVLVGEDAENFNHPWGRPIKNPVIKSWDFFNKAMFVTFAVILPALILAAGLALVYVFLRENEFVSYFMLAPLVLALVFIHLLIVGRFGIDERGSAVYRRTLGLIALACAIFSLVYFIMPKTLPSLRTFAFTAMVFAGVAGLWGLFAYKDKKKKLTAFIYVPLMLCVIAALVFMIIGMINGNL